MKKYFINKKIDVLLCEFNEFLYNKKFLNLVKKFDNSFKINEKLFTHLDNLYIFSNTWDYRKIQNDKIKTKTGESARWLLKSDDYILSLKDLIIDVAKDLTLIGNTELNFEQKLPNISKYKYNIYIKSSGGISTGGIIAIIIPCIAIFVIVSIIIILYLKKKPNIKENITISSKMNSIENNASTLSGIQ